MFQLIILFVYSILCFSVDRQENSISVTVSDTDIANKYLKASGNFYFTAQEGIDPVLFERAATIMIEQFTTFYNDVVKIYFLCNSDYIEDPCNVNRKEVTPDQEQTGYAFNNEESAISIK